jgi:hypothetical protein
MFAIRIENQPGLEFWQSPDPNTIMSSTPERWDLHEAKKFVDEHRTEKQPFAVYHIRGWYHKKIYPN